MAGAGVAGTGPTRTGERTAQVPVRAAAAVVGMTFLAVGVLGFVPGITSNYSQLSFAGHMSEAKLLGLFQVSVLHNLVHLLFGVAGIVLSRRSAAAARAYLVGGGVIYLVLWVYGLVFMGSSAANFVPLNTADNWLHLILGLGMIGLGLGLSRTAPAGGATPTGQAQRTGAQQGGGPTAGAGSAAPGASGTSDPTHRGVEVEGAPGTGTSLTQGGARITGAHAGETVSAVDAGDAGHHPGYGDPAGPISSAPDQPTEPTT